MDSVRQRHYASLEDNLALIAQAVRENLDLRTTPFQLTVPLEVERFGAILREGGLTLGVTATGMASAVALYDAVRQRKPEIEAAMQRIVADKRALMRTPEGRVLTADQLWRALEFFNEVARTIQIISTQIELDSPAQHPHLGVGEISAKVGPVRR